MGKGKDPVHILIDPVCLMRLDSRAQRPTSTYRARTYHFFAESCRRTFEEKPDRTLDDPPPPRKSLWRRYLDRLNKATGGKPPSCCQ